VGIRLDQLPDITYRGEPIADSDRLLAQNLPASLCEALVATNGVVALRGGLHVRGFVNEPRWHSIEAAWRGPDAFCRHYRSLTEKDVPFAQDALGDQFFLRDHQVWKLLAETDDAELIGESLDDFLESVLRDPVGFLSLEPLLQLEKDGSSLNPGELINAYPPFATAQSAGGNVSLRAVPMNEQRYFLEQLSATLRDLPPGEGFEVKFVD
jgi:hypothetical protein